MKKYIFILFIAAISFSIGTSYIVLNKKQYVPRKHLLEKLNTCRSENFKNDILKFQAYNFKFRIFNNEYLVVIHSNRNAFEVWIKSKSGDTYKGISTNYMALMDNNRKPLKDNNSEQLVNFYSSLFYNNSEYHIEAIKGTVKALLFFNTCFYNSISVKPHYPPPKITS